MGACMARVRLADADKGVASAHLADAAAPCLHGDGMDAVRAQAPAGQRTSRRLASCPPISRKAARSAVAFGLLK